MPSILRHAFYLLSGPILALGIMAGQSAQSLELPIEDGDVLDSAPVDQARMTALMDRLRPHLSSRISDPVAWPDELRQLPKEGSKSPFGSKLAPLWHQALTAFKANDFQTSLNILQDENTWPKESKARFERRLLQARNLLALGRVVEAEDLITRGMDEEIDGWGWNILSLALRGELRVWIADYPAARRDLVAVLDQIGDWMIPTSYFLPPGNLPDAVAVTTAQIQSATALSALYLMEGDAKTAAFFAQYADARLTEVFYLANHGLYGAFFILPMEAAWGRALNSLFLATADYMNGDEPDQALAQFDMADAQFAAWGYGPGPAITATFKAWALLQSGDFDAALAVANQASVIASQTGQPDLVWQLQLHAGRALLADNRKDEARQAFDRAASAVDLVTGMLSADALKLRFGNGKEDIARYQAWLALEAGEMQTALEALERGRARAFMDMVAGQQVDAGDAQPIFDSLRHLDQNGQILRFQQSLTAQPIKNAALDLVMEERQKLLSALEERAPHLLDIVDIRHQSAHQIQQSLPDNAQLLYVLPPNLKNKIGFLLIDKNSITLEVGHHNPDIWQTWLKNFSQAVAHRDTARQLVALKPLEDALPKGLRDRDSPLYVVPSGPLFFLPWGALPLNRPIITLPNAGWLAQQRLPIQIDSPAIIIGDPDFGGGMAQLPGARQESAELATMLGQSAIIGPDATEEKLRAATGKGTEILHLATHGLFNPRRPMKSSIILAGGSRYDKLTAGDLVANPVPARLVVLSACDTGLGQVVSGEDYLGLGRSLFLGGTETILNSLWPIDDAGTRLFMTEFHRMHLAHGDYGKAWQQSRNRLKAEGFSPAVYGAFILSGRASKMP